LGDDGTAWGGEWLLVNGADCERVAHLSPLLLAGGDKAAREPWRVAMSALLQHDDTMSDDDLCRRFGDNALTRATVALIRRALQKPSPLVPTTTSMGRYFDAAAAALNVCHTMSYEGQAAMQLESLAHDYLATHDSLPCDSSLYRIDENTLNLQPLIRHLCDVNDNAYGAALFHGTLIHAATALTQHIAQQNQITHVAFGGGCFINELLSCCVADALTRAGFQVLQNSKVPPNDGGLSLGQAFIAYQHNK
jgi:hydrogenase maturation protein HypF